VQIMVGRPAAGGGRWVEVDPARLPRWLSGFAERHGAYAVDPQQFGLRVRAFDDTVAELHTPPGVPVCADVESFLAAVAQPRRLGLLLVRRGGVAVGVADGPVLVTSKVDTSYVQSRTAAGGWSQQRFARRRENQAKVVWQTAADLVARLLLPEMGGLAAVVAGGDRRAVQAVLEDPRLGPVEVRLSDRFLDVAEPRLAVLEAAVGQARAVRLRILEPSAG
jgi:Actinobacteria/chloroflexi VLRF1 release factor